jgi:catechol 2,3-dioxygenase-like lactoylglutathione lyase family enzyme
MKLTHSCIITEKVKQLSKFYAAILQIEPEAYGEDYVEFSTGASVLALFIHKLHEELAPGSSRSASNSCIILEFNVDDVDKEFLRLQQFGVEIVKPITTQEWGNKSFYFRDPDANLINFYSHMG